ncbi:alkaline phosphatase family protein [Novosphingobium sp. FSY-8]|uniref:Alkaline phosphatase family protein n=1 Tax=Novosphingobium ovatum TaxID=1908523 RepID=A0ABW9XCQ2_9SPHN|nr:ectonucleotide pyrophosphatase/phosphodiesterase [Novosphingobium ovatum]NBC36313.1 alkaline phosphatase family protein [Novosphingobium ovatum]
MMQLFLFRTAARVWLASLAAVALLSAPVMAAPRRAPLPTILISIDGFRPDYLSPALTPNLWALAHSGTQGTMRPAFPSITFPNHWTLVTGLRPDRHGVINGAMADPAHPGAIFGKGSEEPFWWEGAEPIWAAAERAGIRTGTMFWPGSSVAIHGQRPANWQAYHADMPNMARAETVLDWMRRPASIRPRLVTLYFGDVDVAGHRHGPQSAQVRDAITSVDAAIGHLRAGLRAMGRSANLVVVSDHGMAPVDPARVVWAKDYLNPADYRLVSYGGIYFFNNVPGHEAALAQQVARFPAFIHCWPKGDLPKRFHYGRNPRVPDWLCLPEPGARIMDGTPAHPNDGGDHGYDPDSPDMRALFIATGPAFRRGGHLPVFDNVDVEPLLRRLIGLPQRTPDQRDGSDAVFASVLMRR